MEDRKPRERWKVSWCSEMPVTEFGDADVDRATYVFRPFTARYAAERFARQLLRATAADAPVYGVCTIYRQERLVDADILQNEGWRKLAWEDVETSGEISSPDDPITYEPARH